MVHVLTAPLNDDNNEIIESELIRLHQKGLISLETLQKERKMSDDTAYGVARKSP